MHNFSIEENIKKAVGDSPAAFYFNYPSNLWYSDSD